MNKCIWRLINLVRITFGGGGGGGGLTKLLFILQGVFLNWEKQYGY
jgi:hypothetical protein